MSNDYEWTRHLTKEKTENRYQEVSQYRLAKLVQPASQSRFLFWFNPLTWFAALWYKISQRQTQPGKDQDEILSFPSPEQG